jgi:hypothetical protein
LIRESVIWQTAVPGRIRAKAMKVRPRMSQVLAER